MFFYLNSTSLERIVYFIDLLYIYIYYIYILIYDFILIVYYACLSTPKVLQCCIQIPSIPQVGVPWGEAPGRFWGKGFENVEGFKGRPQGLKESLVTPGGSEFNIERYGVWKWGTYGELPPNIWPANNTENNDHDECLHLLFSQQPTHIYGYSEITLVWWSWIIMCAAINVRKTYI